MKHRNLWLIALCLLGLTSPAFAQQFDLGTALQQYQTASTQFATTIATAAKWLAVTLATIDFSLLILQKLIKSEGPQEIMVAVIMRVMWYGFLTFLMNANVMAAVINGFIQLGKNASGISVFNPADVFWQGIDLVNIMTTAFADNANIAGVPVPAGLAAAANPLVAFMLGMTIILIVVSFLILTAQYAVILVQMYFYLACYPIIVAMGGIKYGRDMTTKAISAAIVIGVRFLAIYFVMYAAQQMATTMGQQLANFSIADMSPMWAVFGMSGLLAFLALKVPQMASDLLGGTASLSGGDAVAAAAVAGGAAGAIAGGLATVAGGAANGVAGAVKAGQSAIAQARESGAKGFGSTAAGAAGAVGSAIGEAAKEGIKGLGSESMGSRLAERMDTKTAGIREAKAAAGVSSPSVPGAQPAAPTSSPTPTAQGNESAEGSQTSPVAPASDAAPAEASRPTPAAPAGVASAATSQPAAPVTVNAPAATEASAPQPEAPAAPAAAVEAPSPTSEAAAAPGGGSDSGGSAPATVTAPEAPSAAPLATEAGATGGTPSAASDGQEQPAAPEQGLAQTTAQKLAGNLVNELKQADRVQGSAVNIGTGGHE
jgi:type IV secretion system protein TrbL